MASTDNDDDWKPNNRPRSTIALNFSNDLDNTFGMSNTDSGLDGLAKAVEQKKQVVDSQSAELEALNARLRETEERLQKKADNTSGQVATSGIDANIPRKAFMPSGAQQPPPPPQQLKPSSSSLSSSTMNYWRGGGGGGGGSTSQSEVTGGAAAAHQTPSEVTRGMPGGFEGQ